MDSFIRTVADGDGGLDVVLLEVVEKGLENGLIQTLQLVAIEEDLSAVCISRCSGGTRKMRKKTEIKTQFVEMMEIF